MSSPADLPGGRRIAGMPGTFTEEFVVPAVRQHAPPQLLLDLYALHGISIDGLRAYELGECTAIRDRQPRGGSLRWHLSVSAADRHPSWDEIKFARYKLLPHEISVAMFLPPPELYVNVPDQDHVFQLWQVLDAGEPWRGQP